MQLKLLEPVEGLENKGCLCYIAITLIAITLTFVILTWMRQKLAIQSSM